MYWNQVEKNVIFGNGIKPKKYKHQVDLIIYYVYFNSVE